MSGDYIERCQILVIQMMSRINSNFLLTEDEALWYHSALAYLRQVNRTFELNQRITNDQEERKYDADDGAGSTGSVPPPSA